MNSHPPIRRGRGAFTLIELITVIAIIAILMSLLFPVVAMVRETARRNKAGTVVKAIVSACTNYAGDYGKNPPITGALVHSSGTGNNDEAKTSHYAYGDTQSGKCAVTNNELFDVLRGIDRGANTANALNKRKQSYFEELKATDPLSPREGFADGSAFPNDIQGQLLDPWGKQYCIILDADGDNLLMLDAFFQDAKESIRQSVAVFSMARNNEIGGKGYPGRLRMEGTNNSPEDIVSWE